jgi:ppGpp synthetase/RelA/SpoT-type nucleotidyltranferase
MSKVKKPTYEEYPQWCADTLHFDPRDEKYRTNYEANAKNARLGVEDHQFTTDVDNMIQELSKGAPPILMSDRLVLQTKTYTSLIEKTFRHNVVWNRNFPAEPEGGWRAAQNWFSTVNDVVRGLLVCKYLDGPDVVTRRLAEVAKRSGLSSHYESRANDRGYYAYHFYLSIPTDLLDLNWGKFTSDLTVEIQITTQLQEVLKELTHPFYRNTRASAIRDRSDDWKWQFKSPQFMASYLGHTLHLLEGIIVQLKEQMEAELVSGTVGNPAPRPSADSHAALPKIESFEAELQAPEKKDVD